jgi:hypothetical protein
VILYRSPQPDTGAKASKVFGAPYLSASATPSKKPILQGELRFEREVAAVERDAYKVLHDGGVRQDSIRGSLERLRSLGG